MKRTRVHPRNFRRSVIATAIACTFAPGWLLANPVGPVVRHGAASFSTHGKTLQITNSPGTIINWQGFSIAAGETTRFIQQNAASAVLNRVVGRDASSIFGALQSNGRVFLINPNGILFGAGAQINTAGLVASTLDIMDSDFLMGRLRFGNTPGAGPLSNAGEIRTPLGGQVLLISPEGVENSGIIHSPKGEVILAAGKSVELADSANPEVRVEVSAPAARAVNLGKIVAESGRIGIYGGIVANRGIVSADSAVVGENGKVVFKATREASLDAGSVTSASGPGGGSVEVDATNGTTLVAGTVKATGSAGSGGEVRLLGDRVGLAGEARVDVSGEHGGGTALVGGDRQGANPDVRNARMTYVGQDAVINADAGASGDGGKVIVWADDTTRSYGAISARGGRNSGDGGFVETSGKSGLDVRRGPDVRAPAGRPGTWLLDPVDLEVVAGEELDPALNTGTPIFAPLGESSRIGVELINRQLDIGSNVVLDTTSRGESAGGQAGNITISAPIVKTDDQFGTTTLTMQAHNDIVIMPGATIMSTGNALNVDLRADFDGSGSGGVSIGAAISTNGGFFRANGAGAVAVSAPINVMDATSSFGSSVSLASSNGAVSIAAPITAGSGVSIGSNSGVNIAAGTAIAAGSFAGFSATAAAPGAAIDVGAGAAITSRGVTLTADSMNIQGTVNANDGAIFLRQTNAGRPLNLGTEAAGTLSITQLEFDQLVTTGSLFLGNTATGPITVNGMLSGSPAFISITSGASYTQNAGISFLSSELAINAPSVTVAAPLSTGPGGITFTTDTLNLSSAVTTTGKLDVTTLTFGQQIRLGGASPTGSALELSDAQIDMLSTPVRLRFSGSGGVDVAGAISPARANTLSLTSANGAVTQAAGAAITVPNLAASARTLVDLPAPNAVDNFAAQIMCCSAGDISFAAAAGRTVAIGSVDGTNGVTVNNFSGTGNVMLQADDLNIGSLVRVNLGNVSLLPQTASRAVTLGGNVAGTLSLDNTEVGFLQGTNVTVSGDTMNIAGPVTFGAPTTVLAPVTTDRAVKIIGGPKTGTALEFLPSELANMTGATVVLGGINAGPVSVQATAAAPASLNKLVLHSGGTSSSVTVGASTPLSAANSIGITADTVVIQSAVSSTSGNIEFATHTAGRKIDVGADPGTSLGLSGTELRSLSAPNGTISFTTEGGDIDVTGSVSFASGAAFDAGGTAVTGGTFRLLSNSALSSTVGSLSVRAETIDIQDTTSMSAGGAAGNITLTGNELTISPSAATITAPVDINIMPRDFRSFDLGATGPSTGSAIHLDNSELGAMTPTAGVLRIGETAGLTQNILLSSAITLPGRTLSLRTGSGSITQGTGAVLTAASLAAQAGGAILLNELNQVGTVAFDSEFSLISYTRATGGILTVGTVDGLAGVNAGSGLFGSPQPVVLRGAQIDINAPIRGSDVTLLPFASGAIDFIAEPVAKTGFQFKQSELDRITADMVTIGEAASASLSVSAPIAATNFSDLALVAGAITTSATITNTRGPIELAADTLNVGAAVSALDEIIVRPVTGTIHVDLGTEAAGKLALTNVEVQNLNAPTLIFGPTPRIDVTAPINTTASLQFITDDLTIPSSGKSLTARDLFVSTVTSGRTIDLGTAGTGTSMGLDAATLAKLALADTLSFSAPGASTITVSAPLALTAATTTDLALSAGTINVNAAVSVPGDVALRADTLNIATGSVTSTGAGDIEVAPRNSFTSFVFGAGGLMDSIKLARFSTTGMLELGDDATASINITQPLNASAFGGLVLTASGDITQTAGSIITAPKLGVQSDFGSVALTENNAITGPFAGALGSFGTLSFTNAGPLTVGTVDGLAGLTAFNTVVLRSDGINIVDPISANTVTLAPRLAGTAINLGSDTGYGLTSAELNRISAFVLNVGTSGANPSGPITVSAPVDWTAGSFLNLTTAAASSIAVNAALGSSSAGAIAMDAGAGGSVNIAAPVTSSSNISVTADTIVTSQPVTSEFGSVSLTNVGSGGSVTVGGAINAGGNVSLTTDNVAINAPITSGFQVSLQPSSAGTPVSLGADAAGFSVNTAELALINSFRLSVGSGSAGDLTVNAPIGPFAFQALELRSGGNVAQTPGSTITVRTEDPFDPSIVFGSLAVVAGGTINLPEANNVAVSVSGSASGTANNFVFNNATPLRLQNVSGIFASGRVLVRTSVPPSPPPPPPSESPEQPAPEIVVNAMLSDLLKTTDLKNDTIDPAADQRREDAEKAEREEQRKRGTQSCS
jgi:filamentous hemagglutinin family protein